MVEYEQRKRFIYSFLVLNVIYMLEWRGVQFKGKAFIIFLDNLITTHLKEN